MKTTSQMNKDIKSVDESRKGSRGWEHSQSYTKALIQKSVEMTVLKKTGLPHLRATPKFRALF